MPRKILYIHPIFDPEMVEPLKDYLNTYRQKDTQIDVICFDRGVKRLDYAYYQALVGLDILNAVKKAEQDGYDAVIIGCFDDPLLREAKEICGRMAVVGLAEASMHLAMVLGDSFSTVSYTHLRGDHGRSGACLHLREKGSGSGKERGHFQ